MAKIKSPSLESLQQPEKLDDILREDGRDDCFSCRLIGSGAFIGLAGYSLVTGNQHLERNRTAIMKSKSMFGFKSRQAALIATSFGLAWMGVWRYLR